MYMCMCVCVWDLLRDGMVCIVTQPCEEKHSRRKVQVLIIQQTHRHRHTHTCTEARHMQTKMSLTHNEVKLFVLMAKITKEHCGPGRPYSSGLPSLRPLSDLQSSHCCSQGHGREGGGGGVAYPSCFWARIHPG